jgi:cytochrome P450
MEKPKGASMPTDAADLKFDPFAPGPREHRAAIFAELRERAPVYHTDSDVWVVSRFDDVKSVQSTPQSFSSRPNPYDSGTSREGADMDPTTLERLLAVASVMPVDMAELTSAQSIASADPPDHTRLRRIVSRGFTPARIAQMTTTINEIVDRCLAGAGDLDGYDVVERLAVPLPVEMISDILGIGDAGYSQVKRWSDHFALAAVGDFRNTPEGQLALLTALKEFSSFLVPIIEARRSDPQDDVISAMVRAVDEDTLSTVEALNTAVTIMVAGNETSTNLIGNAVVELLHNPDQLALLVEDPSLLPNAVEEANRLTAPIQFAFRETTEETEVAGTVLPKGAIVALHMAAANRDPRQYEDPDRFWINRPRSKNLAFGHGIHFCLGAHLAAQEVSAALGGILSHLNGLRLSDEPLEANPSAILNGWQKVELVRA